MKGSSMFIPGVCAGALLTLFVLAFAAGSASAGRPLHAEPQPFTVLIYATAQQLSVASTPTVPTPAARPTLTTTPATAITSTIPINAGERRAHTPTGVLTSTLEQYFAREEICPIQPGTCAYGFLAGNLDPGIAFLAESPTLSMTNRLMHPAMVKPLATLRAEVLKHWMGQHALTVLRAYTDSAPSGDTVLELRAQGQLVEITLLPPVSPDDLARLCGMAFQAGFNWVDNDGNACRVAMKAVPLCLACQSAAPTPTLTPVPTATVGIVTFTPTATYTSTPSPTNTPAAPNPAPASGNAQPPPGSVPIP